MVHLFVASVAQDKTILKRNLMVSNQRATQKERSGAKWDHVAWSIYREALLWSVEAARADGVMLQRWPAMLQAGGLKSWPGILQAGDLKSWPGILQVGDLKSRPGILQAGDFKSWPGILQAGGLKSWPGILEAGGLTIFAFVLPENPK